MNDLILTAQAVKAASKELALVDGASKNKALFAVADALEANCEKIINANEIDMQNAKKHGVTESMLDRLMLDKKRIFQIADGVRQVCALEEPVGKILNEWKKSNGITIKRVSVPLGVIAMIYEARPNVTVDAAALAFKSGNGILLRGSASALNSNIALVAVMQAAFSQSGFSKNVIGLVDDPSHETVNKMLKLNEYIDVVIPRGSRSLIQNVVNNSTVPVLETGVGNCHIFIDASADYDMSESIVLNAKLQRPAVCNAVETLLIHATWAEKNLKRLLDKMQEKGIVIHGCDATQKYCDSIIPATEKDWADEYLVPEIAVKIVAGIDEAMAHIDKYGTKHTEAIITNCAENAEKFQRGVDAACVNHNASTRFTDGFEFGFGAEIGISTQKLHARGPMGLKEITSYKYVLSGNGQVRE